MKLKFILTHYLQTLNITNAIILRLSWKLYDSQDCSFQTAVFNFYQFFFIKVILYFSDVYKFTISHRHLYQIHQKKIYFI